MNIKTYENFKDCHINEYIIHNISDGYKIFGISKILSCSDDIIIIQRLYTYIGNTKKLRNLSIEYNRELITKYSKNYINKYLIYKSNSLDDCIETVTKIDDIKKYNL
jgi:hypothetical protein